MLIDAHFHIWRPARGDYGWLTPQLGAICRDVEVAHWRALAAPLGIGGGLLVQAAPTEAETRFLLDAALQAPDVLGVVGWTELAAADAPDRVAKLAREPKLKGLRPMLQDIPDPDWMLQPSIAPALQAMAHHGLAFDALVTPVHLPRVRELARRHPTLRIVIDHGAKPGIASQMWQPWADDIARVAGETQASCKLSGLLTEAGARAGDPAALAPWIAHLLRCFGPGRLIWGSDWPVLERAGDYAGWWRQAREAMAHLAQREQDAIFGANARAFYAL